MAADVRKNLDKTNVDVHTPKTHGRGRIGAYDIPRRLWPPDTTMKIKGLSATTQNCKTLEINELCGTESMTLNFTREHNRQII
jgi:hypothetical protein